MLETRRLYYIDGDHKKPLPEWGWYFIRLGMDAARMHNKDEHLVVAAAVPTRAYAAALVSLGIVYIRLIENDVSIADEWSKLHHGTPVIIQEGTKRLRGNFCGTRRFSEDNKLRVGVYISSKKGEQLTRWFLPERCAVSSLPSGATLFFPDSSANEIVENQRFITEFIRQEYLRTLLTKSYFGCLIVGHLNALRAEIRDSTFAIGPEYYKARQGELSPNGGGAYEKTDFIEGNLLDILRVRRFLGSDQAYMMDIFPVEARAPYESKEDYDDTVIVFDGAAGFLKWRKCWPDKTKIVLLDWTDSRFEEAVQLVNTEYAVRAGEPVNFSADSPVGIETIAFLE